MNNKTTNILIVVGISLALIMLTSFVIIRRKRLGKKVSLKHKNPKQVLIVGDSQSAVENSSGGKITYTYPNLLRESLKSKGITIDVLAIGGKTTAWMLQNLPSQLAKKRYDRVILYGGGNDTSNASISLDTTLNNFQQMVDLSENNGADVFINLGYEVKGSFGDINIMPITPYIKDRKQWIPYVQKRKDLQKLLPQKVEGANFIPKYDLQSNTTDGIHPTAKGHQIVAQEFMKIF